MQQDLVLNWTTDTLTDRLWVEISPDLTYEAIDGGVNGFKKTLNGVNYHVTVNQWEIQEKHWISEHYGEQYGYYQPVGPETISHTAEGIYYSNNGYGLGTNGEPLDFLQRQIID